MNSRDDFNAAAGIHGKPSPVKDAKISKVPDQIKEDAPALRLVPGGSGYWKSIRESADREAQAAQKKFEIEHVSGARSAASLRDVFIEPANQNNPSTFTNAAAKAVTLVKEAIEAKSSDWKQIEHMATDFARASGGVTKEQAEREIYKQFRETNNGIPFHRAMYDKLQDKPEHQRWLYMESADTYYINDKNDKPVVWLSPADRNQPIEAHRNVTFKSRYFGEQELTARSSGYDLDHAKDVSERYAEVYFMREKEHEQSQEQSRGWERDR